MTRRGTTNRNDRGSVYDRAARRAWRVLDVETLTVDRIIPGRDGGTYQRSNIRPACVPCNSETGGALARRRVASASPALSSPR